MPRFNRTYRLLVGTDSAAEILPPIRVTFDLQKDTNEQPNHHKVRAYNLAPETTQAMQEPDVRVVLYAGYEEESGPLLIASGDVSYAYSYNMGADIVTEVDFVDGKVAVRDTTVSLGYSEGVKASTIINDIAGQMGLPLIMNTDAPDRTWANGFSYYGAAHAALHKVTRATGLQWSIQNGSLQVLAEGETAPRQAFVISPSSGLLGSPRRTRRGAQDKALVKDQRTGDQETILLKRQETTGWLVESLLLPTLNPGDLVRLESRAAEGWYKTQSLSHVGDWGPGDWKSRVILTSV